MSDIKKLLGKKIKQFRKLKNLTQEELAEKINIEVPSLSNIETGKFAPSFETLQKLSKVLEINIWEFYYFNPISKEKMVEEINNKIKNNEELAKIVYYFLKSIE